MYALVKVTRNGKPFGEGWWSEYSKLELDALPDPAEDWMLEELDLAITTEYLHPGHTAEVKDDNSGVSYEITVENVYFNYDETLDILADAEETVVLDGITGSTTDERLRELVEDTVREIRDATEAEPSKRAIEWWLRLVRDTARDIENAPELDVDDPEYWTRTPDLLEMAVARGLERLREMEGD